MKMKFDKIIMNPPYSKNLHLKILAEAIEHLTDDGKCVNLSPIRWLESLTGLLNKEKNPTDKKNALVKFEDILSYMKDIETIEMARAEELFHAGFNYDLGIYILGNKKTKFQLNPLKLQLYSNADELVKIFKKVFSTNPSVIDEYISFSKLNNISVVMSAICGGNNGRTKFLQKYFWYDFERVCFDNDKRLDNGKSFYENRKETCWGNVKPKAEQWHVEFKTIDNAKHFYDSCGTIFWRFMHMLTVVDVNVHFDYLLWMGDAVNPRTGKKGYESEWTNEDFYKFFNITPEEQKLIEETMEKYK